MQQDVADIVIAGGGMVGASLAVALSTLPLKIVLVEAFPAKVTQQAGYDNRAIALSYGSSQILQGMGIWDAVAKVVNPINSIHVSDRGRFGATRLNAKQQKVPALGYLIEARSYTELLTNFLVNTNVRVLQPSQIDSIKQCDELLALRVTDGDSTETINSKLLIACDGEKSAIREMVGVAANTYDYQQVAVIANISTEMPHQNRAFERFTEQGPIALLPMPGNRCSLVWTLATGQYEEILKLSDEGFLEALGDAFGYRLGRFTRVGKRSSFPLRLTTSEQLTASRVAIVGNAAHSLHPVAGQGLNLALRDIADLAEHVATALSQGEDIGSDELLRTYAAMRGKDTTQTIRYTDSLVKIFSNDNFLLGHARSIGLTAVDRLPALRATLAKQSMGLARQQSRLSRGLPLSQERAR